MIYLKGEYLIPNESRNYKGFNYREYLKTKKIYGTIRVEGKVKVLENNKLNTIFIISNKIRKEIISRCDLLLPEQTSKLLIGILIGDKSGISQDIIDDFKTSNLSHMIAVSGAHTSYIILGMTYILTKSKVSKRWIYVVTIFILILFMFITNFTSSVTRACFMSIIIMVGNLLYRKSDTINSICLSLLIILIANPFSINEIGLELSYLGTIGIILYNNNIEDLLNRFNINSKVSKLLAVSISAYLTIMPIMMLKCNTVSLTFFISNFFAYPFLGFSLILGFITICISLISFELAKIFSIPLNLCLKILIFISKFTSKIPLSKILVKTPYLFSIISIYLLIFILNYIVSIYNSNKNLRYFQKKIIKLIKKENLKKSMLLVIISVFLFQSIYYFYSLIPRQLKVYFIDVGQGDSCLIVSPNNKKILIDGGEGEPEVLLSYLLARRIKTIDYIMISHFDSDHCNGLIEVINTLNVKNIIISNQAYLCDEYKNIKNIINLKKINVIHVKQGDKLNIEQDLKIDILYPPEKLEYDDLNNNSIVAKVTYNSFSILFTGDIEKSEKNLLEKYKEKLKSDVIKVSHHGSKTSSSEEFIKAVKPKIALIGVGENNKFGHPNIETIRRLENINCKIYRTDKMGEIVIKVDKIKRIKIDTML